jgi:cytochrome P450
MSSAAPTTTFDPFNPDYVRDPYPTLSKMRIETPVAYAPAVDAYIVCKYADVEAILMDAKTYSSARPTFSFAPLCPEAIEQFKNHIGPNVTSFCDPPKHTEVRRHNMRVMSARRLNMLEPTIRAKATGLIQAFPSTGEVDLVSALAFPLPALTIYSLIGLPDSDRDMLKEWATDRLIMMGGKPSKSEQIKISQKMADYWRYIEAFVRQRSTNRADDLASDLLECSDNEPSTISHRDIAAVLYSVSVAGHETTTNLILNLVRQLMQHRSQWDALIADPKLISGAVEEGLRFDNSGLTAIRKPTMPVTIRGVQIPAGATIVCMLAAANRDEERFAHSESFDVTRKDSRFHLGFGRGIHLCIGNALARLEVKIVLELLTTRFPRMELTPNQALTYPANLTFRGPTSLHVKLNG